MPKKRADDGSSSVAIEHPSSGGSSAGILASLRGLPRVVWLILSALTLAAGSLCWFWLRPHWDISYRTSTSATFFSREWWSQPRVRSGESALPEISGQAYGVGVQPRGSKGRLWVVGARGLLAYSDDDGQCWTGSSYDNKLGEFRPPKVSPCSGPDAALHWPDLVPTAFAAGPQSPSTTKPAQSRPQPQQQQPQQQNAPPEQQQQKPPRPRPEINAPNNAAVPAGTIVVSRTIISFGTVYLPTRALNVPPHPDQEFTVTNKTSQAVDLAGSGFLGDKDAEFELKPRCPPGSLESGQACVFAIGINPRTEGKKEVRLQLVDRLSKGQVTVTAEALVKTWSNAGGPGAGTQTSSANGAPKLPTQPPIAVPEPAPVAPSSAPDLLAIQFSPEPKMVSTGGLLWTLTDKNIWVWKPIRSEAIEEVGGFKWHMVGPSPGKWATETRVENPAALVLPNDRYPCPETGCTMRSQAPGLKGIAWAAGWTTEGSGDQAVDHAVLFRSKDAGKNWEAATQGALQANQRPSATPGRAWMWPPYWYWAVVLLSAALAAPALLRPPNREWSDPAEAHTGNVEGRLSSDKPLDPGDVDVLGLTVIALGLSRFLRNEKTLPPLTVAVNGEWGSGKSSLMNLLRCDLQSYGMRPVWFNAWHHQKEEHLLAALLQTVRLEAVPPLWKIPFRLRLLWYRVHRRWPALVALGTVAIFLMVVDWHLRTSNLRTDLFLWLIGQLTPSGVKGSEPGSSLPLQGGLLALFAAFAALWKGLTAFGANPAALLASVAQGNKMRDLEAQTSFRQKFAVEFRDFTNALGPKRPLVIFIDDLDRCLPENVRDVLEAVNFLVTSGDCFVVLGIDRVQVQRAIGLSFKEVAEEAGPKRDGTGAANPPHNEGEAKETAREKRAEFAQKYLEKLINLEVRVPIAVDDATKQRLFERPPQKPPEPAPERWLRRGLQFSRWAVPTMLAVLLLVIAIPVSRISVQAVKELISANPIATGPTQASPTGPKEGAPETTAPPAAGSKVSAEPRAGPAATAKASPSPKRAEVGELVLPVGASEPKLSPAKAVWPVPWVFSLPLGLVAVFLLLVANVVLTTRPGVVTHDSQQFTDALEKVWYPLVLAKQNTPRAAKRFVNRVRYLAMRQRGYLEEASWWDRALFPQRLRQPDRKEDWKPIPEPLLVAMAAIEQMESPWIYNQKAFKWIVDDEGIALLVENFPESFHGAAALLEKARNKHKQTFSGLIYLEQKADWRSLPTYRDTFLVIWPRADLAEAQ